MEESIFQAHGILIVKRDECYYIQFDAGELAVVMVEAEITEVEAKKAMLSEKDAYEVLITCQKRGKIRKLPV
jgi:hypothetical protein